MQPPLKSPASVRTISSSPVAVPSTRPSPGCPHRSEGRERTARGHRNPWRSSPCEVGLRRPRWFAQLLLVDVGHRKKAVLKIGFCASRRVKVTTAHRKVKFGSMPCDCRFAVQSSTLRFFMPEAFSGGRLRVLRRMAELHRLKFHRFMDSWHRATPASWPPAPFGPWRIVAEETGTVRTDTPSRPRVRAPPPRPPRPHLADSTVDQARRTPPEGS